MTFDEKLSTQDDEYVSVLNMILIWYDPPIDGITKLCCDIVLFKSQLICEVGETSEADPHRAGAIGLKPDWLSVVPAPR